ncbi:glycerol-3-phosphate dehydrogenase [Agromyces flavus]|uniref:Glycerol-3-phosphate dehydrogenase n=1 Tax=Agromyces flavus TaxID=589382 RepID=A0A1H1URP3_9MICO|nr:glycerol-3-phosphate dehydrogenase/oxidase [Agromyces flavus]MCP2368154.1 glycerol-3-phosphate dehydrogenase [Agromyces flavus]GGI47614.1 glycerol-3-phosphate dehydrogenase [Agromyces flavus]SDS75254.1 glycerol-3-phosphate dehydrogenase [Agromyces flavus]
MSPITSTTTRPHAPRIRAEVSALRARPTAEVVIIGGGINGLATFRDLALQGVDVVLVERDDFVSGASSASSHMIHGGIRYLENGEFRLVKESVEERNGLLKIAPHYVKPLRTTVPIHSTFSGILSAPLRFLTHKQGRPTERGAALIKAGLTMYDAFSRDGGSVPRHRFLGAKKSLAELPALNPHLKYTATYFDASMHDPERLALDVLFDGLAAGPHARAANHLEAIGFGADGVRVRDAITGEEFDLAADVVVNASGPWTDLTNARLGRESRFMGGTKGSHIVLDHPELLEATGGREIFFEHEDGRIVLIYPLKGRVMVGTTDLEHDMREPAVCTEAEVDYFFDLIAHVFPGILVDRLHIVYRFSGVRPLPRHDDTQPGFVSRDYRIERADVAERPGTTLLSLVGGKWTTFRALAEHLADEVLGLLGRARVRSTKGLPIGGGAGYPTTDDARLVWVAGHGDGVGRARAEALLERYGTRAEALIREVEGGPETPLAGHDGYTREEVAWLVRNERVVHLADLVLRRTSLAFTGALTPLLLDELAAVAGDELGWEAVERRAEVEATLRVLADRHGVVLEAASLIE